MTLVATGFSRAEVLDLTLVQFEEYLAAAARLRSEELAGVAIAIRQAQFADQKEFGKYIKKLTGE